MSRNTYGRSGIFAHISLESEEEAAGAAQDPALDPELQIEGAEPESELPAESVEAGLLESEAAADEVDAGVADIESAGADADTLDDIADTMEAANEEGGLEPQAAEISEIAIESIYDRVRIPAFMRKKMSLESFGDEKKRVKVTTEAIEDVRAKVVAIWKAAVAAVQRIIAAAKKFITDILEVSNRLRNRAASVLKTAGATKGVAEGTVKGGFTSALSRESFSKDQALKFVDNIPAALKDYSDILGLANAHFDYAGLMGNSDKLSAFSVKGGQGGKVEGKKAAAGMAWYSISGHELPVDLQAQLPESDVAGEEALKALAQVRIDAQSFGGEKGAEAPVLSIEEIKRVCKSVGVAAKAISEAKVGNKAAASALAEEEANIKKASTNTKSGDAAAQSLAKLATKAAVAHVNAVTKAVVLASRTAGAVASAGLNYAEASLAKYKEATPAAADAAAAA